MFKIHSLLHYAAVVHLLDVGMNEQHVGDSMASKSLSYWTLIGSLKCMLYEVGPTQVEL